MLMTRDFLPIKRFEDYFDRMERFFGEDRLFPAAWPRELGVKPEWKPTADIIETEKEYLIKAELPEVAKADVKVDVADGRLTLRGERRYEKKDEAEKMQRMERFYGTFERTFLLPEDVEIDKIKADFKDGMLKLHLPRLPQAQKAPPVQVRIQ